MRYKMLFLCIGFCLVFTIFCTRTTDTDQISNADPFLGRWALDLPDGAGWLGVIQESGEIKAELLWCRGFVCFGGSGRPCVL